MNEKVITVPRGYRLLQELIKIEQDYRRSPHIISQAEHWAQIDPFVTMRIAQLYMTAEVSP